MTRRPAHSAPPGPTDPAALRSPKRRISTDQTRSRWFPYYAGFSGAFVEDAMARLPLSRDATVMDPWLGAGTTAEIAGAQHYRLRGYDLNPAMLVVARARMLPSNAVPHIPAIAKSLCDSYEIHHPDAEGAPDRARCDTLERWLDPISARRFRLLERSVASLLIGPMPTPTLVTRVNNIPAVAAFFYVCLFRSLRSFLAGFQTTNPTWIKLPTVGERLHLTADAILDRFRTNIDYLLYLLQSEQREMPAPCRRWVISRASSLRLPLASETVDAIISSPPYCTRLDYVRATLPELTVIGYANAAAIRRLSQEMIGTTTMVGHQLNAGRAWGATCRTFLQSVASHPSKASSTYYLRYYSQYYGAMYSSLRELNRVMRPRGHCVLVVQDSYYKEVRNDLSAILVEMASGLGWQLHDRRDFIARPTLAGTNPRARLYRRVFSATESALVFTK